MKYTRAQLIASGFFERLRKGNREFISGTLEREARNAPFNRRYSYTACLRNHLSNGCIALILREGDGKARESFAASVEYALKLVGAPPTAGGGVRIYEANVELSEEGSRLTSLHEKKPAPGGEKLTLAEYHRALICVGCFGALSASRVVAAVPEEAYQNPDEVASPGHWPLVRSWKAFLLDKEAEARREAQSAVAKGSGSGRSEGAALLALLDADQKRFDRSLQEAVKLYVKATSAQQGDPLTFVFFPGLMLSRMALHRGMVAREGPYLPLGALPLSPSAIEEE